MKDYSMQYSAKTCHCGHLARSEASYIFNRAPSFIVSEVELLGAAMLTINTLAADNRLGSRHGFFLVYITIPNDIRRIRSIRCEDGLASFHACTLVQTDAAQFLGTQFHSFIIRIPR